MNITRWGRPGPPPPDSEGPDSAGRDAGPDIAPTPVSHWSPPAGVDAGAPFAPTAPAPAVSPPFPTAPQTGRVDPPAPRLTLAPQPWTAPSQEPGGARGAALTDWLEQPPASPSPSPSPRPHADPAESTPDWSLEADGWSVRPRSAVDVLGTLSDKVSRGAVTEYQPIPLGFTPLDRTIGGGIRTGDLMLIGGAQGTGKTTLSLQMARNIALGGQSTVLYICFEHDEEYLLNRLIALESAIDALPQTNSGVKIQDVRREIVATWMAHGGEHADLATNPRLRPALERIRRYGQSLFLMRGSQSTSTVDNIRRLVERYKQISGDRGLVVFVDYLQKIPLFPEPSSETEKVTTIVNGLKDVALSQSVPLVSIVAADKEGLKASRLRNHHLRGSSALNYEADVILILNEKYNIVAKVNIEFNPYQAQRFRDWVVVTVEKNRGGQHSIDMEYEKHFEFSCFDPNGRTVQEKLIEERLYND